MPTGPDGWRSTLRDGPPKRAVTQGQSQAYPYSQTLRKKSLSLAVK